MIPKREKLPKHVRLLLDALADAGRCASFSEAHWDSLLRAARSARLLGVLEARTRRRGVDGGLPEIVARHLLAASVEARFRRSKVEYLLDTIGRQLAPLSGPLVLLKGSAYIAQQLEIADGRLPADVDLMVPRASLDKAEQALLSSGWVFQKNDTYDQHYYRAWSHELPPMHCVGQALELDLHHAILPPLGRLKPDTKALFDAAVPVADTAFAVLCPVDQALHAAAHLFQDSDCFDCLRDLVDFDGLVREHSAADPPSFWSTLTERARLHGLGRPLWYAVAFSRAWLELPVPPQVVPALDQMRPGRIAGAIVAGMAGRTLPPVDPESERSRADRLAGSALEFRALWLRMPAHLLAYHAGMKAIRSLRRPVKRPPEAA